MGRLAANRRNHRAHWLCCWPGVGIGRYWKRRYHKAMRQWTRAHGGRERSVVNYGGTVNWKTW